MSCTNNPVEKNKYLDNKDKDNKDKDLKQKYLETSFLSTPIHEYVKIIALVFSAQYLGTIVNQTGYNHIMDLTNKKNYLPLCILFIFVFCYINSNLNFELSIISTIIIMIIYYIIKILNKKK
jgi:hypothetical protein